MMSTIAYFSMLDLPLALASPDPAIRIRPVQLYDTEALHRTCWPDRPLASIYQLVARAQQNARNERGLGVVACPPPTNTVIGFGQLTSWPGCGEISDLIIAPNHRNHGLGTALIQYLVRCSRELSLPAVEIGAAYSNPSAINLYRRLGFRDYRTLSLNLGHGDEPILFLRLAL